MTMLELRCTSCGAPLKEDSECSYCGLRFDVNMFNPYWELFKSLNDGFQTEEDLDAFSHVSKFVHRGPLVRKFSWAIPDDDALDIIRKHSPQGLVELGAGKGYWASLLKKKGVDVLAFDKNPVQSNDFTDQKDPWFDVLPGDWRVTTKHKLRTLFLCWPTYDDSWAYQALKNYHGHGGKTLIYVGEHDGGCCADDKFFEYLSKHFVEIAEHDIPHWWAVHDRLWVYRAN